ncbi:pyrroline-5-carboxylate reductase [filamentous cyanobacterium CCP5]|nr:pyrroline-5-carboxylate reductase [filamentous cyanobacterium CCP5]
MADAKLGVIGGGMMGEALISRLLDQGVFGPEAITIGEPGADRRAYLQETYGIGVTASNQEAIATASVVLLAIKPQILAKVAPNLAGAPAGDPPLLLSILAGTPLAVLEGYVPGWPVVRAMPNTPATVGAGVTAIAAGDQAGADHVAEARRILASVGDVVEVPEYLMDAVTGLSGSGPAYVALMVEALADGGVAAGLPRAIASRLALQTVRGTAELLHTTQLHPAQLKDRVTSPGGTTIAGVAELEAAGLRSALIRAVQAACRRSQELGR